MEQEHTNAAGATPPEQQEARPFEPQRQKNTGMAVVAYILFFVPLLTDAKDDPFVKYHVKQGLTLFIAWFAVSVVSMVPPILFVSPLLHLGMFILLIIGIMHALNGKEEELPVIGQFAKNFTF